MKKTLHLVKDSILCAIICMGLMLLNAAASINSIFTSMLILVFMSCYFQNKKVIRPILSAIVILFVSFLTISLIDVLLFILPNVILGVVTSQFLQKVKNNKVFFSILTILYFIFNFIVELLFSKFVMNVDFMTYVMSDPIVELPENVSNITEIFLVIYIILVAAVSFMEVLVIQKGNIIYKKRIMKIIKEEPLPEPKIEVDSKERFR